MYYDIESQAAPILAIPSVSTPGFLIHGGKPMGEKRCGKCLEIKELSEFHFAKGTKTGRQHSCKACRTVHEKGYKWNGSYSPEVRRNRTLRWRERNRPMIIEKNRKWKKGNPQMVRAGNAISNSIRDGRIVRPKFCENCGDGGLIDGHHDDYNKPLEVRWLCKPCHRKSASFLTHRFPSMNKKARRGNARNR